MVRNGVTLFPAGSGPTGFSVCMVNGKQNSSAGPSLRWSRPSLINRPRTEQKGLRKQFQEFLDKFSNCRLIFGCLRGIVPPHRIYYFNLKPRTPQFLEIGRIFGFTCVHITLKYIDERL